MITWQRISVILILGLSLLVSACSPGQLFGPTFTPSPTITLFPTSTPTLTPTHTATTTPTYTNTPSPTPTPFGGGGQLLVVGYRGDSPTNITSHIYSYNISVHQTNLILDNYILEGVSPDGSKLLISPLDINNSVGKLYITDLDGSNPVLISTNFDYIGGLCAYWFSDSDSIVFRGKNGPTIQLYARQSDGSIKQITKSSYGVYGFLPVLSDGGIYWEEDDGYRSYGWRWTNIDGTGTRKFQNWDRLAISPNGEYVAYDYLNPSIPGTLIRESDISRTDGSSTIKLDISEMVKNPSIEFPPFVGGYIWFPNSQRILVTIILHNSLGDTFRYLILSTSGEFLGEIDMGEFSVGVGSWSPDGRQYVFITGIGINDNYVTSLKVLDIETMQIQDIELNISNDTRIINLFWLP